MSHRFKLLFITSLVGFSLASHAMAGSPSQAKSLLESDRLTLESRTDLRHSIAAIEQQIAASPTVPRPTPASPAATSRPNSLPSPAAALPSPAASASPTPPSPPPPAASSSPSSVPASASSALQDWLWWGAIGLLPIAVVAGILYTLRPKDLRPKDRKQQAKQQAGQPSVKRKKARSAQAAIDPELETGRISSIDEKTDEGQPSLETRRSETNSTESIAIQQTELTVSATTRLTKIDIVEALIQDLHQNNADQRRKAIWELGQRGDSRAIQPLVDLLIDSDSNQRGLILAAVAEINIRALKPMNRALMLSIQDASPDVRKNAIRDATRVFELVAQTNQLLQYANSDTDADVRKTAEWAMGQLNRIRPLIGTEGTPPELPHLHHKNGSLPHLSALTESTHAEIAVDSQEETEPLRDR